MLIEGGRAISDVPPSLFLSLHSITYLWDKVTKKALSISSHAKKHFIEDFLPAASERLSDYRLINTWPLSRSWHREWCDARSCDIDWALGGSLSIAQREMAILLTLLASSVVIVIKAREEDEKEEEEEALNDTNALIIAPFDSNCGD